MNNNVYTPHTHVETHPQRSIDVVWIMLKRWKNHNNYLVKKTFINGTIKNHYFKHKDNLKIKWTTMKNQRRNPTMRVSGCLSQMAAQLLSPFISVPSLSLEEKGSLLPWSFLSLPHTNEHSPFVSFFWQPHPENKKLPLSFPIFVQNPGQPSTFSFGVIYRKKWSESEVQRAGPPQHETCSRDDRPGVGCMATRAAAAKGSRRVGCGWWAKTASWWARMDVFTGLLVAVRGIWQLAIVLHGGLNGTFAWSSFVQKAQSTAGCCSQVCKADHPAWA